MKILTYVEIDVRYCDLQYGVAPCEAVLGVTGEHKCFNTVATCQDRENIDLSDVTLRFARPTAYLPIDIQAIPSVTSVNFTPGVVSLGENLGQRSTLSVTFEDHRHSDTGEGYDKYHAERDYNPYDRGTFWGKFRARQPYLRGRAIRLIRGELGQAIENMETRHFVVESFDGPTTDGKYTLTAKDVLKLADGDRAQAPVLSNGFLVALLEDDGLTTSLSPSGIGNLEYPTSGFVAIGGKEICEFTRVGDVLTLDRGQFGTVAQQHSPQDRVQLCLQYTAQDPSSIIADLLINYAAVSADYVPVESWLEETSVFLRRLYTTLIAEPTSVSTLVSEIIEQAALAVWWSDTQRVIRLQVLRPILTTADTFTPANRLANSFQVKEQPDKRLSQVWTYFGQINPLKSIDDIDNYRSTTASVDLQSQEDNGVAAIKKIFSRWIPAFGRLIAIRLNTILLSRYRTPPRQFRFAVHRSSDLSDDVILGQGYRVEGWSLQDATGAEVDAPVQVTQLNPLDDRIELVAEEALFADTGDDDDLDNRTIIIDSNVQDFNLRDAYDTIYPDPVADITVTCIVEDGVIVGSTSAGTPSFDVGDWPADVNIILDIRGRVQGAGGLGGVGAHGNVFGTAPPGSPGGPALKTMYPLTMLISTGEIYGGGGGGGGGGAILGIQGDSYGGGGGGGGRGFIGGSGASGGGGSTAFGSAGSSGTSEVPGTGGLGGSGTFSSRGGDGGEAGTVGQNGGQGFGHFYDGPGGPGGTAGAAVDGISFITVSEGPGDIRGAQIN